MKLSFDSFDSLVFFPVVFGEFEIGRETGFEDFKDGPFGFRRDVLGNKSDFGSGFDFDGAGFGSFETEQKSHQGGFSGTVSAEEADLIAPVDTC